MRKLLKKIIKQLLFRPLGVNYGIDAYIKRPCTLHAPRRIHLGDRSCILDHAYISPIEMYAGVSHDPKIVIGADVYIGRYVYLTAMNEITIGDGCVLSEHVYITDLMHGLHPMRGPIMKQPLESKGPVRIGRNCFLGYRVSVMPGVILGEHCVVGANSVVTGSFPAYSMVVGSPAKLVKVFSPDRGEWVAPTS